MALPNRLYKWRAVLLQNSLACARRELEDCIGRDDFRVLMQILEAIRTAKTSHALGVEILEAVGQPRRGNRPGSNEQRAVEADLARILAGRPDDDHDQE